MRQLKLLGLAIVAMLSLGIAVTSMAQAAELKGLPEKAKFTFKNTGEVKLLALSGKEVKCTTMAGNGESVSERLGTVEVKYSNCTGPLGVKCTGLSDTEGTITVKGEVHLRHLLPASEGVLVAYLMSSAHFSCLGVLFVVHGCLASMSILTKEGGESAVNKLLSSSFTEFLNENPTSIATDNSLGMEECVLKSKEGSNAEESAGWIGKGTVEKCEKEGKACTGLIDLGGTP